MSTLSTMRVAMRAGSPGAGGAAGSEHRLEGMGRVAVVLGHELGDLGAAVAELGAGAAGFDDGAMPKGATSWATDSQKPSMPHLVAFPSGEGA
jgi:hypothetical protein